MSMDCLCIHHVSCAMFSLHWSLVIVCIPDKEDESNLTILHLDSLGLHSKRSIVDNVKRYARV